MKLDFMSKTLVIILLGPPGAGKGSQATLLREKMTKREIYLSHISTGDLLRENIKKQTPLGLASKALIDAGKLVPDPLILELLFERVSYPDCNQGYILDGFPRTLAQAQAFQQKAASQCQLLVFHLQIPDEQILERVTKRLTCENCQRPYHKTQSPPKEQGICDVCKGNLYQRSDDNLESVEKRLQAYHEQTKPLLEYFADAKILYTVDSSTSKETAFKEIMQIILENRPVLEICEGFSS